MNHLEINGEHKGNITQNKTVNIFLNFEDRIPNIIPFVLAVVLLLIAPFVRLPYGFFIFLRLVTCGAFLYVICNTSVRGLRFVAAAFILLYNPLLPVSLTRSIWSVVNISTALVLLSLYFTVLLLGRAKNKKIGFEEE